MTKFNRKFNSACSRLAFWHNMASALAAFDNKLKIATNLTPEDVIALKSIHRKLYECYCSAKGRTQLHGKRIDTLRKELLNGSKTIN